MRKRKKMLVNSLNLNPDIFIYTFKSKENPDKELYFSILGNVSLLIEVKNKKEKEEFLNALLELLSKNVGRKT